MSKREKLSRASIVEAAMELIEAEGERAFSMRRLAARLGVDPMTLYHHYKNKTDLLDEMMQALLLNRLIPEPTEDWRRNVRNICGSLRDLAHRFPHLFRIYELYEDWAPAEYHLHEALLSALQRGGFSERKTIWASRQLIAFTEAFAVDEVAGWMEPQDVEELKEDLADGPFPVMSRLLDEFAVRKPDEEFEFGLDVLLRGLESEKDQP